MINLKPKVNKSKLMRELTEIAEARYEKCYEAKDSIDIFMDGARALLEKLQVREDTGSVGGIMSTALETVEDEICLTFKTRV